MNYQTSLAYPSQISVLGEGADSATNLRKVLGNVFYVASPNQTVVTIPRCSSSYQFITGENYQDEPKLNSCTALAIPSITGCPTNASPR